VAVCGRSSASAPGGGFSWPGGKPRQDIGRRQWLLARSTDGIAEQGFEAQVRAALEPGAFGRFGLHPSRTKGDPAAFGRLVRPAVRMAAAGVGQGQDNARAQPARRQVGADRDRLEGRGKGIVLSEGWRRGSRQGRGRIDAPRPMAGNDAMGQARWLSFKACARTAEPARLDASGRRLPGGKG
jgi:hypothetical protein